MAEDTSLGPLWWLLNPQALAGLFGSRTRAAKEPPKLTDTSGMDWGTAAVYRAYQQLLGRDPTPEELNRFQTNILGNKGALAAIVRQKTGIHTRSGQWPQLGDPVIKQAIVEFIFEEVGRATAGEKQQQKLEQAEEAFTELARKKAIGDWLAALVAASTGDQPKPLKTLAMREFELRKEMAEKGQLSPELAQLGQMPIALSQLPLQIAQAKIGLIPGPGADRAVSGLPPWLLALMMTFGAVPELVDIFTKGKKKSD